MLESVDKDFERMSIVGTWYCFTERVSGPTRTDPTNLLVHCFPDGTVLASTDQTTGLSLTINQTISGVVGTWQHGEKIGQYTNDVSYLAVQEVDGLTIQQLAIAHGDIVVSDDFLQGTGYECRYPIALGSIDTITDVVEVTVRFTATRASPRLRPRPPRGYRSIFLST